MKFFAFSVVVILCLAIHANGKVVQLGDSDFASKGLGSGKNLFVKFFAPWCGHCKNMKPDWDRLGAKWNNGGSVLIVDVDCTGSGKSTCQSNGVSGYPTIKYFKDGKRTPSDYQGGRDYNSLDAFVKRTLDVAKCDPVTKKNCKKNEIKFIDMNKDKSANELEDMLAERTKSLKDKKQELREAEKVFREKEKEFKKEEKKHQLSSAILKGLIKAAKGGPGAGKSEL